MLHSSNSETPCSQSRPPEKHPHISELVEITHRTKDEICINLFVHLKQTGSYRFIKMSWQTPDVTHVTRIQSQEINQVPMTACTALTGWDA